MKLRLFILCVWFSACNIQAQFRGIIDYMWDTTAMSQLKKEKVKSVTETITGQGKTYLNGYCTYNQQGKITEACRLFGIGFSLIRSEYDNKGLLSKQTTYDQKDTSKIAHWLKYLYDDKGRQIKEIEGFIRDDKSNEFTKSESVITEKNSVTRTEKRIYSGDKVYKTEYSRDSTSGIYTFKMTYEYNDRDTDEKGRKRGKKKLHRIYTLDHCHYEDIIDYDVYGRIETGDKIKSYYHLYDAQGRELEFGSINYDDALMNFIQTHPSESNYMVISPVFLKEFFAGKIQGEKKINGKCTYDDKGQVIEKQHYSDRYTFKYNNKGQVLEQIKLKPGQETTTFEYNKKGLITKSATKTIVTRQSGLVEEVVESAFEYQYW